MIETSTAQFGTAPANAVQPPMPPSPELGVGLRMWQDPLSYTTQILHERGDIVHLNLGLARVFLIGHPDYAQYVLREHAANFTKHSGMWDALRLLGGDSLGTSEGDVWLRRRRMMQPLFNRQRLSGFTSLMTDTVASSLGPWQAAADSAQPLDLGHAMERITMRLLLKTICSASIADHEISEMSHAIETAFRYIWMRMWTFFLPEWLPLPGQKNFRKELAKVDRIVYRIIQDRRNHPYSTDDLLSLLFHARDETNGEGMTDKQIHDDVVAFYVAGFDTIATALTFCIYAICQHPQVEKTLREEIDQVLQGRTPDHEDLGRLNYTRMVLQESMRLYPPAWLIPRKVIKDDVIGGYHIPKNSILAIHFYAIQRHPEFWSDPDTFNPERFASEGHQASRRCIYIPFGAGARQCIGNNFALMEGQLFLAMLLQRFRFELCSNPKLELDRAFVLRPKNTFKLRVEPNFSPASSASPTM